ncbi:hypothetical protein F5Y17DRAFT_309865 [Xylariaceae sp. FL0594]|nr:hypothetical protein F5Y17DRAFT_309865 [Xylariaceae sp. FL0594]
MANTTRCTCPRNQNFKNKAKQAIRSLLNVKFNRQTRECRACKVRSNRQGVFIVRNPRLERLLEADTRTSAQGSEESRAEIRGLIWGPESADAGESPAGVSEKSDDGEEDEDENEILVKRIYSMLLLENSSVIEFLESRSSDNSGTGGGGLDMNEMPEELRRCLERVIAAQVQMS